MRTVYLATAFALVLTVSVLGLRGSKFTHPPMDVFPEWLFPGMKYQPKYKPQGTSAFFADGRADRSPLPGWLPPTSDRLRSRCTRTITCTVERIPTAAGPADFRRAWRWT